MAVANYGAFNPKAVDPWPVEGELAKIVGGANIADAQGMLNSYGQQRQAATNVYMDAAEQQHEFAKQQLAQQLVEARMKAIPEYLGKPGGEQFLTSGAGAGLDTGLDPRAVAGAQQEAQQHYAAQNLMEGAKGFQSLSEGGLLPDNPQALPGLQSVTGKLTDTSRVRAELIRQQTEMMKEAGRGARAKAGAGAGSGTGFTVGFDVPNEYGGTDHVSANKKVGQAQIDAFRLARGMAPVTQGAATQALPDVGGAQAAASSRTSLPPAPNNAASGVAAAQQQIMANLDKARNHPAYADIVAGMKANGGKPIVRIENGAPVLYGASGKALATSGTQ